jgi:uncharacterized protein
MRLTYFTLIFCLLLVTSACREGEVENYLITKENHETDIENWYNNRISSLKSENGWLNLVGLYWFENESNRLGKGENVELEVKDDFFPESFGTFEVLGNQVYFKPDINGIKIGAEEITEKVLVFDPEIIFAPTLAYESYRMTVIQRSDLIGLRLRNIDAVHVQTFQGIERFPVSLEWRFQARFIPYDPAKEIPISNVLGQTYPALAVGKVSFGYQGRVYSLDALEEGDQLFLIFADGTSGAETYGGGRYLYTQKADENGIVILDFNKAFNPPCVFTPYATCPLPPKQNILELAIEAGEQNWGK